MIGLSTIEPGSSDITIVGALALSGVGLGLLVPSMSSLIANVVDVRDLGVVGASQQMLAQLGAATGIQIMQTVQAARENAVSLADSYSQAYLVGAAVACLGLVCALFVRSTPRGNRPRWNRRTRKRRPLLGHLADLGGELLLGLARLLLLEQHHLGHVPLGLDLARHEGLHSRLRVLGHEDGLGRLVVGGQGQGAPSRCSIPMGSFLLPVSMWDSTVPSPKGTSVMVRFTFTC